MDRIIKWLGLAVAGVLLVVGALLALLYIAVDEDKIRVAVRDVVAREFGAQLEIAGDMVIAAVPAPTLVVKGIHLRAGGGAEQDLAALDSIVLRIRILPLLRRELQVSEARISGLKVHAVRDANGNANWDMRKPAGGSGQTDTDTAATPPADDGFALSIAEVRIDRSEFVLEDLAAGSTQRLELAEFSADGFNLQSAPFRVAARGHLVSGAGDQVTAADLDLGGNVSIDHASGQFAVHDLALQLHPEAAAVIDLKAGEVRSGDDGALSISGASLHRGSLALEQVAARLRSKAGLTQLDELKASLHGGTLTASGHIDSRNRGAFALDARLAGTDLRALLQGLGQPPLADGLLDGSMSLRASGAEAAQWKATLAGPVSISVREPVIHDINVEELVCKAAATLNKEALTTQFEAQTRLDGLETALDFTDGVGRVRTLAATLPSMALAGSGSVDLPGQKLRLQLNARVTRDPGEIDTACRMTRKMLALEWPITCRGQFDQDPKEWCGVTSEDLGKIATQLATQKFGDKIKDKLRSLFGNDNN